MDNDFWFGSDCSPNFHIKTYVDFILSSCPKDR